MTRHTITAFEDELRELKSLISRMGGLAESALAASIDALLKRDVDMARKVIDEDKRIDDLEREIETQAIEILARRQPVADDLREIVSTLKISSDLERIGDYAKNIAKRATVINQSPPLKPISVIPEMTRIARKMINDVLDAFIERDAAKALAVWQHDEQIDELYNSLFRELLTYMMESPSAITPCTHLLFVAKNIERVGDHITNIAEIVHYVARGEMIDAARPKSDTTSFAVAGVPPKSV
ncbi:MAG TPA: phosphate signaling complex protein PhoU [Alphaproteobacteria bacterium]|nr:phosphate signaling complex protein PhoU [Alphaproteobacteria bacterium]